MKPAGETEIAKSLHQVAEHDPAPSLIMLFSDLLGDPEPILQGACTGSDSRATT